MEVRETNLDGVVELIPKRHADGRGYFSEVFNQSTLESHGISITWTQDNEAKSFAAGTVRGIHFQVDPAAQDKLVRASRGRVLDVAIDLRRSSPTFGRHVAVELSEELGNQLLVPQGFGHAYCTLEPNCVLSYKVSGYYSPEHDRSLRWDDDELAIAWPVVASAAILSPKDLAAPLLSALGDSLYD